MSNIVWMDEADIKKMALAGEYDPRFVEQSYPLMKNSPFPITIYLSGPMTGRINYNTEEFAKYAKMYRDQGFTVISPPELDEGVHDEPWSFYMRRDINLLLSKVDRVYVLPDWFDSRGASLEVAIADAIGIPIYYAPDGTRFTPLVLKLPDRGVQS